MPAPEVPIPAPAVEPSVLLLQHAFFLRMEAALARRRLWVLAGLLVAALSLRAAMSLDLLNTPFPYLHEWDESDMHTFDGWAKGIVMGDIWSRGIEPPYHVWHNNVVKDYAARYPERWAALLAANHGDERAAGAALWRSWCGDGRLFQEPLYAYFVAAIYRLGGPNVLLVFAVQMLLGCASLGLLYWIACEAFGECVGLLAALLILLYPTAMFYEFVLLRDAPLNFFGLMALLGLQSVWRRPTVLRAILSGAAMGVTLLLKGHFAILLLAALALLTWKLRRTPRTAALIGGALFGGALLGQAPLFVRNAVVGVPIFAAASNAGPTFIIANAGSSDYLDWKLGLVAPLMEKYGQSLPRLIWATVTSQPSAVMLRLAAEKLAASFDWFEIPNNVNFNYAALQSVVLSRLPVNFAVLGSFGVVGLFLARRAFARAPMLYAYVLTAWSVLILFFVFDRFRLQLAYALAPFAALCALRLVDLAMRKCWIPLSLGLGPTVAICSFSLAPLSVDDLPVRMGDYVTGHEFYFNRVARRLAANGNWAGAAATIRDELELQPGFVRRLDGRHAPANGGQADVAELFGSFYLEYADLLQEAHQPERAQAAAERGQQLGAAVAAFRSLTSRSAH